MNNILSNTTRYFCIVFLWMLFLPANAIEPQNYTNIFAGKIIDQYGKPILNVKITQKKNGYIEFSHSDYLYKEIKIKNDVIGKNDSVIILTEKHISNRKTIDLPYKTVDKAGYLGAESTITTNQLSTTLSSTIISAFAGQISGLYTEQYAGSKAHYTSASSTQAILGWIPVFGAGNYSDNSQFNISSRHNSPVAIVDGVQREIYSLDPEAIESVSMQKDALSSMLLGMRSSRGVLVVTTKKPIMQGVQFSFTSKYGFQQQTNMPKPLSADQYAYLLNEALLNDGKSPAYSYEAYSAFKNGTSPYTNPNINWYDQVLNDKATIQSYNLNVTGGGKTAQYFVNLEYFGEDGFFRKSSSNSYNTNSKYERYIINSKINVNVTNELKANISVMGRIENGNQPGVSANNILNSIYTTPNGAYPINNPNGSLGGNVSFSNNLCSQTVNSGYVTDNIRDGMVSLVLNYDFKKILKGLTAKAIGNVSTQSRSAISRTKQSVTYKYTPGINGEAPLYDAYGATVSLSNSFIPVSNYQYLFGQIGLDYNTSIGLHELGASVSADVSQVLTNYNLPQKPTNLLCNLKYNYNKKYYSELALSRSYYNGYAPDKRWGTFYAVGLGWIASKESLLADINWLDLLKFRAVYGKTGNGIDNTGYYTWKQTFSSSVVSEFSYPQGYARSGLQLAVLENSPLANANLTWEKAHKVNVGVDLQLFGNQVAITADYYNDRYYDVLQTRGKSIELMGMTYPTENIGKYSVHGVELSATYQNHIGKFNYFITANWSQENTKLLYMDEQFVAEANEYNKHTGKPLSAMYGLVADGFFASQQEIQSTPVIKGFTIRPGDVKYKDLNNDGVIDQYDQKMIGGDKPLSYFGLNLGFEYHGFGFSMLVQGVYNRDIYLNDPVLFAGFQSIGQGYGQAYEYILNRWTPETANTATLPRLKAGGNPYNSNPNYMATSLWVRSGNYIRLKNLSVGYTFPESFSNKYLGKTKVKVFVDGQNLLTQSACSFVDPEVTNFTNFPLLRGMNVGVNIKF